MADLFDLFQLIATNTWVYGGAFIIVLSILVFVHEWGHYYIAIKNGVKVEQFSIGFGKEIWGFNDKRGTRWKVSIFPLGGYVKMFGDIDPASAGHTEGVEDNQTKEVRPFTEEEKKVAFFNKSVAARSAIVFAGPAINFLFAIILLAGLFTFVGQPVTPPIASAIMSDTAASKAGFLPHDKVIKIDNKKIRRFEDIRREVTIALDTPLTFTVLRGDKEIEIVTIPEKLEEEDRFGFNHSRGFLGVVSPGNAIDIERIVSINGTAYEDPKVKRNALVSILDTKATIELDRGTEIDEMTIHPISPMNEGLNIEDHSQFNLLYISEDEGEYYIKHNPFNAVFVAVKETWVITRSTLEALGQMFTGTRSATELGGIIRIGAIAGDMAQSGLLAFISFTALLSINLGLINLFPIPMLDGGHLFFYAIEAARGKPLSEDFQEYAFRFGLAVLVALMLFANINDIVQILY
jgi:regulator of sigma E protease